MFGKKVCFYCSGKDKKVNMAQSKDGHYLCPDCRGKLGRFYPGCFIQPKDDVIRHLKEMEKMRKVYEEVFLKDEDLITIKNGKLGIFISEKYGLFKIIDEEWAEFNAESEFELFRFDQINRYELFNEHRENVYINNGAFIQCGIRIYMNSTLKKAYNRYKIAENQKTHDYISVIEVLTASEESLDPKTISEFDGMKAAYEIEGVLKKIMGETKEEMAASRKKLGEAADLVFE